MKDYDIIVIGTGAGLTIASRARNKEMKVALVENGPMGGTCLNRGCIPSKILTYPAEVVRTIEHAKAIGVHAKVERLDFDLVRKRMWDLILPDRHGIEEGVRNDPDMDLYHTTGFFVAPYTMQVNDEQIKAPRIVISCGVRSQIPEIKGLEEAGYLLSETVFDILSVPRSITILGGGYKACEFGHFFSAFGTKVTILGRNPRLLPREEPEVSERMLAEASHYMDVHVNSEVLEVKKGAAGKTIVFHDRSSERTSEVTSDEILVTTGVTSNADTLNPGAAGIALDKNNYIVIDQFMQTSQPSIFAMGDVIGRTMFRHTANYHVDVVWYNMFTKKMTPVDEHAVPHAVFGYPEVASVGITEAEAKAKGIKYLVGKSDYFDCAKGYAMGEEGSFVKVIVTAGDLKILGVSAIGAHAAILVQAVVYLMNAGDQSFVPLARSQTIHPALSEAVVNAFGNLEDPAHQHHHENG
jgi:dihydrolipoamide dehydrogenase